MFLIGLAFVLVTCIVAYVLQRYIRAQEAKRGKWLEQELEVPQTYNWEKSLITKCEDLYFDELEKAEAIYCEENKIGPNDPLPRNWPSMLKEDVKTAVKMRLMERAMAWVYVYRKMEAKLKSTFPLYKQNIVSQVYFNSVKEAESQLEEEFQNIKKEVTLIDTESSMSSIEIFKEACRIIDSYGYPPQPPKSKPQSNTGSGSASASSGSSTNSPASQPAASPPIAPIRKDPVYRASDNKTYELMQAPDDAELAVFCYKSADSKSIKVETQKDYICVKLEGKVHFEKKLPEHAQIKPSETTWAYASKSDFEPGDPVELFGLSTADLNGLVGKVEKATKETTEKGRIRVNVGVNPKTESKEDRILSIKPDNLKNLIAFRKAAIVISMEKLIPKSVWKMPPWEHLSEEEKKQAEVTKAENAKTQEKEEKEYLDTKKKEAAVKAEVERRLQERQSSKDSVNSKNSASGGNTQGSGKVAGNAKSGAQAEADPSDTESKEDTNKPQGAPQAKKKNNKKKGGKKK